MGETVACPQKRKTTKALAQGQNVANSQIQQVGQGDYNTQAQESQHDASREENDARTPSSSTKTELGKAFAQILYQ